ncbi:MULTISPECIES: hypothetical protein [Ralstonia solanacearum species complex]|uniref:Uncharacterized protein n=1 Tax=Ralstonia solanacearum TaxID=305 RepID=A0AAE3NFR8_RALSL|nr:hypothetical protein [Ralstonia solanacearum]ALF90334.1 hypothetical protein RSUY_40270 [Ralstonia solanacearum]MBB6584073.1 hypothetical protein [Ralstonia solanacearum]MDB0520174.1 hypothetical protein [Ralstonia solanacearum]MDC6178492.1 hypothetical protein [Ralstonia solanacearum]MDC6211750.1 hypothetical protein [Ralstonia solanacearum]
MQQPQSPRVSASREHRPSVHATRPAVRRAGLGVCQHQRIRQRQMDARPGVGAHEHASA